MIDLPIDEIVEVPVIEPLKPVHTDRVAEKPEPKSPQQVDQVEQTFVDIQTTTEAEEPILLEASPEDSPVEPKPIQAFSEKDSPEEPKPHQPSPEVPEKGSSEAEVVEKPVPEEKVQLFKEEESLDRQESPLEVPELSEMADQEASNGAAAAQDPPPAEGEEVEVPKKCQKPKEPPVTFREFEVRIYDYYYGMGWGKSVRTMSKEKPIWLLKLLCYHF